MLKVTISSLALEVRTDGDPQIQPVAGINQALVKHVIAEAAPMRGQIIRMFGLR